MKIGILGNEGSWYVDELCRTAKQLNQQALPLRFPELQARVMRSHLGLRFGEVDVANLDAIIVRTMPPGSLEQVVSRMDVLAGAESLGVRMVNRPKAIECAVDKYLTTQRLAAAAVRVPDTILCESSDAAMDAFEQLGRDVVVKPLFGAEGRGILRVDHPEMALRVFRTLERLGASLYLQKFLRGPLEDIRILLLDGQLVASMKRIPKAGDFRSNAAQQGRCIPWTPSPTELQLAQRAADVTGCAFCGVDVMYDENHQPMVIEVNAVPGWRAIQRTCDVNVPLQLLKWLESTC